MILEVERSEMSKRHRNKKVGIIGDVGYALQLSDLEGQPCPTKCGGTLLLRGG